MELPSLLMPAKKYPAPGRCVFCLGEFPKEELTDEHIIPLALNGGAVIADATCRRCQKRTNEGYEQSALNSDYLVLRLLLQLKRRKKRVAKPLPKVALGNFVDGAGEFDVSLDPADYPPLATLLLLPPAGLLVGEERGGNLKTLQLVTFNLSNFPISKNFKQPVTTRTKMEHSACSLMLAKIALCYAVAKLGIDGFHGSAIRDLLNGHRSDTYNFVGSIVSPGFYPKHHLHELYLKDESNWLTVIVHLFASIGMTPYQVVVGKRT